MPITFNCACGKTLRVPDEHAGRRAKCPACNAVVSVPAPDPVFEIVEEPPQAAAASPAAPAKAQPVAKPYANPHADDEEHDGTTYGLADDAGEKNKARGKNTGKALPNFRKGGEHHKNS